MVKQLDARIEVLGNLPDANAARLTALELLVRSHAETIGNVKQA
jgi:hypothetical protein